MGVIKINNIIYGSNLASDIIYKNTTVEEKLNAIPVFDPSDNINIEDAKYDYLTYGHIVDGLTSDSTDKVLSANQGKVLNEKINNIDLSYLENGIDDNAEDIKNLTTTVSNNYNSLSSSIDNNFSTLSAELDTKLSKTGGSMTGTLHTNVGSVAIGSKEVAAGTLPELVNILRYQNGGMGSVNLTTAYSPVAAGWWNYIYIPHRTGGSGGDNSDYGNLILIGMTQSIGTMYTVTIGGGGIRNITAH